MTKLSRGGTDIEIHRPPKPDRQESDADPVAALEAVKAAGAAVLGEPIKHPKHFEVLGQKGANYTEYHVEFDGRIRKEKPVRADDHKWAAIIGH